MCFIFNHKWKAINLTQYIDELVIDDDENPYYTLKDVENIYNAIRKDFNNKLIDGIDIRHLKWICERLINVYNENPEMDYMIKFKDIINKYGGVNARTKLRFKQDCVTPYETFNKGDVQTIEYLSIRFGKYVEEFIRDFEDRKLDDFFEIYKP